MHNPGGFEQWLVAEKTSHTNRYIRTWTNRPTKILFSQNHQTLKLFWYIRTSFVSDIHNMLFGYNTVQLFVLFHIHTLNMHRFPFFFTSIDKSLPREKKKQHPPKTEQQQQQKGAQTMQLNMICHRMWYCRTLGYAESENTHISSPEWSEKLLRILVIKS